MRPSKYQDMDYYRLYLQDHLREHHFAESDNELFIDYRVESAYNAFMAYRLSGRDTSTAGELAMRILLGNVYVSRWDVIMQVIEEDLWARIAPEDRVDWAELFLSLRYINNILDDYDVNGDFLERGEYPSLHARLLGEMSIILDGYGL